MSQNIDPSPISRACAAVDGQARLGRLLGVTPGAVSQWVRGVRPVPADRAPDIERLTREHGKPVLCEELRPDVAWHVLRGTQASPLTAANTINPAEQEARDAA